MILPLLEALLPLLLLFATDFLGRGIERYANGLHPEPTLAVGWGAGALGLLWVNRYFVDVVETGESTVSRRLLSCAVNFRDLQDLGVFKNQAGLFLFHTGLEIFTLLHG